VPMKEALKSLADFVGNLKRNSFGASIRHVVEESAKRLGIADPFKEGQLAAQLYDDRGALVHDGVPPTMPQLIELRRIVRYVLEASALYLSRT
jgi:hypothetical protein